VAFVTLEEANLRLAVVLTAAASDVVDGMWARRLGGSRIGVVLDPICDKLFMVTTFAVVFASDRLLPLEILGVLIRDIVAFLAFLTTVVLRHPTTLPARAGGKAVTVCQILTLIAFVMGSELLRPIAWATAAISVYAITDYVWVAWKR
jgi:cardiolipin synthase